MSSVKGAWMEVVQNDAMMSRVRFRVEVTAQPGVWRFVDETLHSCKVNILFLETTAPRRSAHKLKQAFRGQRQDNGMVDFVQIKQGLERAYSMDDGLQVDSTTGWYHIVVISEDISSAFTVAIIKAKRLNARTRGQVTAATAYI